MSTIGCFLGVLIGQVWGDYIQNNNIDRFYELLSKGEISMDDYGMYHSIAHYHKGVFIWFFVFLVFLVLGIIIKNKTKISG